MPRLLFDNVEVVSKHHLASDSNVASLFKMLTYFLLLTVCCAFSPACALLSNAICYFETTSGHIMMVRSIIVGKQDRLKEMEGYLSLDAQLKLKKRLLRRYNSSQ